MHGCLIGMHWNWDVWYELWHGIVKWWFGEMRIGCMRWN